MRITRALVIFFIVCLSGALSQPVVVDNGVLNGASFDKSPNAAVAPGSLVSIFGTDLAASLALNDTVPLSTMLADVVVKFNGIQAGLDFVSPTQINAQLPWNVLPDGAASAMVDVVVTRGGVSSTPKQFRVAQFGPGVFSIPPGVGHAIAINADGSLAAPAGSITGIATHPAKVGDVLVVYATGLGAVDSPIENGANSLDKLRNTIATPTVLVGGKSATVLFSGLTPQFPGVNQLNITVPLGVPPGNAIPLQIQLGGVTTTDQVTIAVQ